jgi:hypothetical protein
MLSMLPLVLCVKSTLTCIKYVTAIQHCCTIARKVLCCNRLMCLCLYSLYAAPAAHTHTTLLLSLQELLLIEMILDDRIKGKINQIDGYLELGDAKQTTRYA